MSRLLLLVPTVSYRAAAFVRAAQRLDIDITLASEKPSSLREFHPVDLITLDFDDPDGCAVRMKAFAATNPIDAVVGVDDQVTVAAAAIAKGLGLPHNPVDAAHAARNKHTMRTRLARASVPQPNFRAVAIDQDPEGASHQTAYPSVLKPLMMAASRWVIRVNTPREFVLAFRRIADVVTAADAPNDDESRRHLLVEEYVPGWEVAVEGMLTNGQRPKRA